MKNQLTQIGNFKITQPELVTKLAVVMDDYKFAARAKIWEVAEQAAKKNMPAFNPKDFFFEETIREARLVYQFRYYTPPANRSREDSVNH